MCRCAGGRRPLIRVRWQHRHDEPALIQAVPRAQDLPENFMIPEPFGLFLTPVFYVGLRKLSGRKLAVLDQVNLSRG